MTKKLDIESNHPSGFANKKKVIIAIIAILLVALLILLLAFLIPRSKSSDDKKPEVTKPLNVILLIGDGFGPAAAGMARSINRYLSNNTHGLNLDKYLVGSVQTLSANSLITDSSAAATTYATGFKTLNDAVSIDPITKKPLGTIFEAAQAAGIRTGLVVTTRISDATPACFYSHSLDRDDEAFIISQLLEKNLTVVLGGGKDYFTPQTFIDAANSTNKYHVVNSRDEMMNITSGKILGVFQGYDLPYEVDRLRSKRTDIPSLNEMSTKALDLISQDNEKGFILMLEGSQIDVAAHSNDASGQYYETQQFDLTFQTAIDFAKRDGNTIVIATADHETGGLTLGVQPNLYSYPKYIWRPADVLKMNASAHFITTQLFFNTTLFPTTLNESIVLDYINQFYSGDTRLSFSDDEMKLLMYFTNRSVEYGEWSFEQYLGEFVSKKAGLGWTTGGHTGVDVNLYYYYSGNEDIKSSPHGNIDNTEIGKFIASVLNLDLDAQTTKYANFVPHPIK